MRDEKKVLDARITDKEKRLHAVLDASGAIAIKQVPGRWDEYVSWFSIAGERDYPELKARLNAPKTFEEVMEEYISPPWYEFNLGIEDDGTPVFWWGETPRVTYGLLKLKYLQEILWKLSYAEARGVLPDMLDNIFVPKNDLRLPAIILNTEAPIGLYIGLLSPRVPEEGQEQLNIAMRINVTGDIEDPEPTFKFQVEQGEGWKTVFSIYSTKEFFRVVQSIIPRG